MTGGCDIIPEEASPYACPFITLLPTSICCCPLLETWHEAWETFKLVHYGCYSAHSLYTWEAWVSKTEEDIINTKHAKYPTNSEITFLNTCQTEACFPIKLGLKNKVWAKPPQEGCSVWYTHEDDFCFSCVILHFKKITVFNMSSKL